MSKGDRLLPCPFCGAHLVAKTFHLNVYQHPDSECYLADFDVAPVDYEDWNRRQARGQQEPLTEEQNADWDAAVVAAKWAPTTGRCVLHASTVLAIEREVNR